MICAYCMTNVETFSGWENLIKSANIKSLQTKEYSMQFSGMSQMISDEGLANTIRIMMKYMFNSNMRKRMSQLTKFFCEHQDICGYGIYVAQNK